MHYATNKLQRSSESCKAITHWWESSNLQINDLIKISDDISIGTPETCDIISNQHRKIDNTVLIYKKFLREKT